jgi:uncharacterized Tic20 family protein
METPLPPLPGTPASDLDRVLAVLCHLSPFFGLPFIVPIAVYVLKMNESPWLAAHAKETLNFHLTLIGLAIISCVLILACIGWFLCVALGIFASVCAVIGAIRAAERGFFRYPLTLRLI